jgi:hypothetical protein
MRRILVVAVVLATPAVAEDPPMTAEAFDSRTLGRVMDTYDGTGIYGIEEFLPGRRVIWQDGGGCMRGTWEQIGDQICFDYEDRSELVCWTYHDRGGWIMGWFEGDRTSEPIMLVETQNPLTCDDFLGV